MTTRRLLFLLLMLAASVRVIAQNNDDELFKPADLTIPESPAFVALGVSPQEVSRPMSPAMFGASVLNAVDNAGKLQNGFALEATPYLVFHGTSLRLGDFRDNKAKEILSRLNVSFATTKATDADPTQRLALGAFAKLIDAGDPRSDTIFEACVRKSLNLPEPGLLPAAAPLPAPAVPGAPTPALPEQPGGPAVITQGKSKAIEQCRVDLKTRSANRSSLIVAFSPVWMTPTGEWNDLSEDGGAIWTSLAYGFDRFRPITTPDDPSTKDLREDFPQSWLAKNAQLILHARWRDNERIKNKAGAIEEHDGRLLGARFRVGGERTAGSIEISHLIDDTPDKNVTTRRLLAGLEQRLTEGLWLQLSFGRDFGGRDGNDPIIARSSFRWAFSEKAK